MSEAPSQRRLYQVSPELLDYAQPTWDALAKELRLTHKAKVARRRLLRGDRTALDAAEEEIESHCAKRFEELSAHCSARKVHCERWNGEYVAGIAGLAQATGRVREEGSATLGQASAVARRRLDAASSDERAAMLDLAAFRLQHQREFDAQYPASRNLLVVILVVTILAESLLNAYFFKEGGELGLAEGIVKAFLVSVANVMFAFVFGGMLLLRQMRHVRLINQLVAFLLFVPFVAAVVGFNLLIAHYRTQLEKDPINAMTAAWETWLNHPMQLGNVSATVLFVLGIIAAAVACIDALFIDDPYPGYGRIDRRFRDAQAECNEALTEAESRVRDIGNETVARIDSSRQRAIDDFALREAMVQEVAQVERDFLQRRGDLLELRRTALSRLRDQVSVGSLGPDAGWFDRLWALLRRLLHMKQAAIALDELVPNGGGDRLARAPPWADAESSQIALVESSLTREQAVKLCDDAVSAVRNEVKAAMEELRAVVQGRRAGKGAVRTPPIVATATRV